MPWLSDIEIAQNCTMHPIGEIAQKAHVDDEISGTVRQLQGQGRPLLPG